MTVTLLVSKLITEECEGHRVHFSIADARTDDSYNNCVKAHELGWHTAHLVEDDAPVPKSKASEHQIRHLEDLRSAYPEFFKTN